MKLLAHQFFSPADPSLPGRRNNLDHQRADPKQRPSTRRTREASPVSERGPREVNDTKRALDHWTRACNAGAGPEALEKVRPQGGRESSGPLGCERTEGKCFGPNWM